VASNGSAGQAYTTTQIAAAASGIAWLLAEWAKHGKATSLGFASGLVAGLVAITPASGFVPPWAALVIGATAGLVCYGAVLAKARIGYDDALDAFGVHGVGGFLGAILTGVFAVSAFGGTSGLVDGAAGQVWRQLVAALSAAAYAGLLTWGITALLDKTMGFRLSERDEIEGLDLSVHGEQGWMLSDVPAPAGEYPGQSVDVRPVKRPVAAVIKTAPQTAESARSASKI
jgi:Amt family ammonium transporter